MPTPFDYSDQRFAKWFRFWLGKLKDEEAVLHRAYERFPGESPGRLNDLLQRTKAAIARMPPPLRSTFGQRHQEPPNATTP
jgi:hypothetical protein